MLLASCLCLTLILTLTLNQIRNSALLDLLKALGHLTRKMEYLGLSASLLCYKTVPCSVLALDKSTVWMRMVHCGSETHDLSIPD